MEVWFRSFSFLNGWFEGSMLIFQGVSMRRWCMIPIIEMNGATQLCISYAFIILYHLHSPQLAFSHLTIGRAPKWNNRISTIHFQGRTVGFREGRKDVCCCWKVFSSTSLKKQINQNLGGGFKYFLFSPRNLGKMNPIWRAYFSNGLGNQPPTRFWFKNPFFWGVVFFFCWDSFWKPRQSGYRVLKTESSLTWFQKTHTFLCFFLVGYSPEN